MTKSRATLVVVLMGAIAPLATSECSGASGKYTLLLPGAQSAGEYYVDTATDGGSWVLMYESTTSVRNSLGFIPYTVDQSAVVGSADATRFAFRLQNGGHYAWVSVPAWRDAPLGVPTGGSRSNIFVVDKTLAGANVISDAPGVANATGTTVTLQLWPWDYLPGPSGTFAGNNVVNSADGVYGSFQIFDAAAGECVFAWQGQRNAECDIGFGSSNIDFNGYTAISDWTYAANGASPDFRLQLYAYFGPLDVCASNSSLLPSSASGGVECVDGSGVYDLQLPGMSAPAQLSVDAVTDGGSWALLYETTTSVRNAQGVIPYSADYSAALEGTTYSRVAFRLQNAGSFAWVSMPAWRDVPIGVPTGGAASNTFVVNKNVSYANIVSDAGVAEANATVVTVQIWPTNYMAGPSGAYGGNNVPTPGDYGSFQIYNAASDQVVFAWQGQGNERCDIGFGNSPSTANGNGEVHDWTFFANGAAPDFQLQIYVLAGFIPQCQSARQTPPGGPSPPPLPSSNPPKSPPSPSNAGLIAGVSVGAAAALLLVAAASCLIVARRRRKREDLLAAAATKDGGDVHVVAVKVLAGTPHSKDIGVGLGNSLYGSAYGSSEGPANSKIPPTPSLDGGGDLDFAGDLVAPHGVSIYLDNLDNTSEIQERRRAAAAAISQVDYCDAGAVLDYIQEFLAGDVDRRYTLIDAQRMGGAQAVVSFVRTRYSNASYASKFFLHHDTFVAERDVYELLIRQKAIDPDFVHDIVSHEHDWLAEGVKMPSYIVMKRGVSMQDWVRHSHASSSPLMALWMLGEVATQVARIHEQGFVHRDLKPGNIIYLQEDNSWRLVDFGCAVREGACCRPAFTLHFAPPEVIVSTSQGANTFQAHFSADVWAVGVMALELFTGELLFPLGASSDVMRRMLRGDVPFPHEARPEVLAKLGRLRKMVQLMLSRDPQARPSMLEISRKLNAIALATGATTACYTTAT